MSKFKKFFGVAAVVAAAAGVIAYFMKKDRSVEPEFETPNDDEEFEQDLKDLFDDYKEEAPAAKATGEQPEETSTEAKSQPEENEKEETAEETSATKIAKQEEARGKESSGTGETCRDREQSGRNRCGSSHGRAEIITQKVKTETKQRHQNRDVAKLPKKTVIPEFCRSGHGGLFNCDRIIAPLIPGSIPPAGYPVEYRYHIPHARFSRSAPSRI